jgi:hypothetical protein
VLASVRMGSGLRVGVTGAAGVGGVRWQCLHGTDRHRYRKTQTQLREMR